jgi:hypothetical protein
MVTALIFCPLLALGAAVPNIFTAGTTISSAQVNANFADLANRLTALEKALNAGAIPDTTSPAMGTDAAYVAASAVHLPLYKVSSGEVAATEVGALCVAGDYLLGGGCIARDAAGTETCTVERSYPISANEWFCRSRKANGQHTDCRTVAFATCLKSK